MVDQELGEICRHLRLFAPREANLENRLEACVRGRARGGEPIELLGVLDRAQHGQRGGHRHIVGVGQGLLEAEQLQRPRGVGDRVRSVGVEDRGEPGERVGAVDPVGQRDRARTRRTLGVGALEGGQDHRRLTPLLEREQRQALGDRHRRVPGEVDQIGPRCDEHAGQARGVGLIGRAPHPPGEVLGCERRRLRADGHWLALAVRGVVREEERLGERDVLDLRGVDALVGGMDQAPRLLDAEQHHLRVGIVSARTLHSGIDPP